MWEDPIVSDVRRIREQLSAQFDYDVEAIFSDMRKRQEAAGQKLVRECLEPSSQRTLADESLANNPNPSGKENEVSLIWTAWKNGKHGQAGTSYGLKVPITDRDKHFQRNWSNVTLEFPTDGGFKEVQVNVAKPSFWNSTCHELIDQEIARWLSDNDYLPWPPGRPPKFAVEVKGNKRFRVAPLHD